MTTLVDTCSCGAPLSMLPHDHLCQSNEAAAVASLREQQARMREFMHRGIEPVAVAIGKAEGFDSITVSRTRYAKAAYAAIEAMTETLDTEAHRLLVQTLEAIDSGRSEPLFIMRDAIRNWLEDNPATAP